ncbi:MAG TPA: carotenoid biosynthesis protein [Candidatus Norongarragalinales archaeon]|nr:carotenoid biosynthesis protein [Candidatus Norongarragalinales archaeon]
MFKFAFVLYELFWLAVLGLVLKRSLKNWGLKKTAIFFIPAIVFGFLLEWTTQTVFERYHYGEGFLAYLLNVPISVSITWGTLMYLGFVFTKEKILIQKPMKVSAVAAAFLVLADFFHFEPFAKTFGFWAWTPEGLWFGAPLNNFYGWFWVGFLFLSAFQLIDSKKWDFKKKAAAMLLSVPVQVLALTLLLKLFSAVFGKI